MATFVDRVTAARHRRQRRPRLRLGHARSSSRSAVPTAATAADGGDVVLVVDPNAHAAGLPPPPAPEGGQRQAGRGQQPPAPAARTWCCRCPPAPWSARRRRGRRRPDRRGNRFVVARGGHGGLGNASLAIARRKAPGFALLGEPGEALDVVLELKCVADVGLVGFPQRRQVLADRRDVRGAAEDRRLPVHHAGAQPGRGQRRRHRLHHRRRARADPGRSQGKGLGLEFLRHVERCAVLVHVLDCATMEPGRDPISDLERIEASWPVRGDG